MIPINIKLKTNVQASVDRLEKLGNLVQTFPGEQGELALLYMLGVDKNAEEKVLCILEDDNIEYAEIAPLRKIQRN